MMRIKKAVSTMMLLGAVMLLSAQNACGPRKPEGEPPSGATSPDSLHAALVRLATEHYTYGTARPPRGTTSPDIPPITIATATEIGGPTSPRSERIVARIKTEVAYPRLGIPTGTSYVWRDTAGGLPTRRMLLVPADLRQPMVWLRVRMTPKQPGDPTEPIFMVTTNFLLQGCDPNCEAEHCTTGDTIRNFNGLDTKPFREFVTRSSLGRFVRW